MTSAFAEPAPVDLVYGDWAELTWPANHPDVEVAYTRPPAEETQEYIDGLTFYRVPRARLRADDWEH